MIDVKQSSLKTPFAQALLSETLRRTLSSIFIIATFLTLCVDVPGLAYLYYECTMTNILLNTDIDIPLDDLPRINALLCSLRTDFVGLQGILLLRIHGVSDSLDTLTSPLLTLYLDVSINQSILLIIVDWHHYY